MSARIVRDRGYVKRDIHESGYRNLVFDLIPVQLAQGKVECFDALAGSGEAKAGMKVHEFLQLISEKTPNQLAELRKQFTAQTASEADAEDLRARSETRPGEALQSPRRPQ